jgi:hypothetical protein
MKNNCLDIGTIQAFLDGELSGGLLETAADHLAACDDCAVLLANSEEESAIAFTALDAELNTLVPTKRLWAKINDSIEKERKPFWQTVFAYFKNPTVAAFASLAIVFGLFMVYMNSQNNLNSVADVPEMKSNATEIVSKATPTESPEPILPPNERKDNFTPERVSTNVQNRKNYQVVNANIVSNNQRNTKQISPNQKITTQPAVYQYLPGEESYIKTIATLENNLNSRKDEVLKPSERFTFEQNLAVVNDSITKMQKEVKKNPRNKAAKQILMASYQNKVDLLNSVSEQNELMALR